MGNGDGTFPLKSSPTAGTNPASVGVGDINGDGRPETAVGIASSTISATSGSSSGSTSLTVTPASQAISFSVNTRQSAVYQSTFTVAAGASSVIANQAGSGNYSAAPTVTQTVNALKANPVLTWPVEAAVNFGGALARSPLA